MVRAIFGLLLTGQLICAQTRAPRMRRTWPGFREIVEQRWWDGVRISVQGVHPSDDLGDVA